MDATNKLVGTWKLISASSVTRDGERNELPTDRTPRDFSFTVRMAE